MTDATPFAPLKRNPDVLTCIANLSNDEVFTPPEFAARMLDTLAEGWASANNGANLWADSSATFLDPCTKSGVFLREIAKRLIDGLANEMPDLQARVDHILTKQLFGIGITRLTALLARRSLYCSKLANGAHSVAQGFESEDGNIWFQRTEHSWVEGRCRYCAASREVMDREEGLESHAYAFIHTDGIKARIAEWFGDDMQFDVIIGNPPYQMTGAGGGTNDAPIYQHFVEQAMGLDPRFLSMVIPSRWMAGGRGLGEFRAGFLADKRLRAMVDHENAKDVFPSVGIGGGICYFLWDRDHNGLCECTFNRNGELIGPHPRTLDEFDVFVRDTRALSILRRVVGSNAPSFEALVSGDTPFGLATNFTGYTRGAEPDASQVRLYANLATKRVQGAMSREAVTKNLHLLDTWKLFLPVAGSGRERERSGIDLVLGPPMIGEPGSACTQTYLVAGPLGSEAEARSVESYLKTRLTRFLVSLRKPAQHVFRGMYRWVPQQSWDRTWTDAALYEKYGITAEEQTYIESMIRPMESAA
ncbi:MAG: Eco57I restriction-modification methylase domain-containing protein [Phenylobacterium sp.]|nr:Eco57I restriction-modification methylase domain-containing protein [Phenylobacterium sp.]MCA6276639.1 Eco57I restriction-modification methylase domain-containing protein [Phenylobacterium sp.]MCA6294230.1 Eco57I restriction-modification methylase domain-containing protein [Phenylobacterium sp.]